MFVRVGPAQSIFSQSDASQICLLHVSRSYLITTYFYSSTQHIARPCAKSCNKVSNGIVEHNECPMWRRLPDTNIIRTTRGGEGGSQDVPRTKCKYTIVR